VEVRVFSAAPNFQSKLLSFLRFSPSEVTASSHIQYTICRSGTYYYDRREPSHAVEAYGLFIRQVLSKCPDEAAEYAKRLGLCT